MSAIKRRRPYIGGPGARDESSVGALRQGTYIDQFRTSEPIQGDRDDTDVVGERRGRSSPAGDEQTHSGQGPSGRPGTSLTGNDPADSVARLSTGACRCRESAG